MPVNDRYIASIDMGSHTARFLLCRISDTNNTAEPVIRKRVYTSTAHGFDAEGTGTIGPEGIKRAIDAVSGFLLIAQKYRPEKICGAATGIFRRAENGDFLLNLIREKTGIDIETVSGEKEALYTLKGIVNALDLNEKGTVLFDLGGSTTEFIYGEYDNPLVRSLPIGALILTDRFLKRDSADISDLYPIYRYIDDMLEKAFLSDPPVSLVTTLAGSGGTVTSIAALINGIDVKELGPERINGLTVDIDDVEGLLKKILPLRVSEKLKLAGIDRGRAEVITAGTAAVLKIMKYFRVSRLTSSYSDILEGQIISYLQGDKNE